MAEDEYRPYANIDFLVAAKELNSEELKALREEATAKYQKYQYLTSELQNFTQRTAEQRNRMMHEQAQATIQELSNPETGIPGWGPKLYEEIGNYAVSRGMSPEAFASILDAPNLRALYDGYRYDRARKVKTTKKAQAPQKVLKSSASSDSGRFGNDKAKASISKLRQSGSREDAAAALLSRWGVDS
jgi:MoxR-like ATPase